MTKLYVFIFLISILGVAVCTHVLLDVIFTHQVFLMIVDSIVLILAIFTAYYAYFKYSRIKYTNFAERKQKK